MKAKQVLSTDFEDKNGRTDKKPLMRYFTAMKPRAGTTMDDKGRERSLTATGGSERPSHVFVFCGQFLSDVRTRSLCCK